MDDFATFAMGLDPARRAQIMAQAVRGQPLQEANQQAHALDNPAIAAMMSNNPALAQAAQLASKNQQAQYKPMTLGHQGFALPATGEFVSSPMYEQEQGAARQSREQIANANIQATAQNADANRQAMLERTQEVLSQRREATSARDQAAAEGRQLRLSLAAMGQGSKAATAELKVGADTDKRINKFTTTLDKASVPEFENSLSLVKEVFDKYPKDIPGYGRIDSLRPDFLSSDEGVQARQKIQQAANVLLKSRSGAAVTDSEMRRFLTEVSMGKLMSADAVRTGWGNVARTFEAKKANLLSGVNPADLEEYNARTGSSYSHGGKKTPTAPTGGAPAGVDPKVWEHMTPEERKLWN